MSAAGSILSARVRQDLNPRFRILIFKHFNSSVFNFSGSSDVLQKNQVFAYTKWGDGIGLAFIRALTMTNRLSLSIDWPSMKR